MKKLIFLSISLIFIISSVVAEEELSSEDKDVPDEPSSVEWITMPVEIPVKRYSDSAVIIPPLSKERLREAIEKEMRANTVEIFIQGEEYQSLKEYKKSMNLLKEKQQKQPLEKNVGSKPYSLKGLTEEDLEKLSKEELKGIIQSLQSENSLKVGVDDSEAKELQQMADEYLKTRQDIDHIAIDPKKVKTIIISDSHKKDDIISFKP